MTIYAVNGKEPVAAWIPSLDTAGNGTTTLTDLISGTYNGTLTNMNAATDWVADTDAGGVRALDLDGIDDYIQTSFKLPATGNWGFSGWFKTAQSSEGNLFSNNAGATGRTDIKATSASGGTYKSLLFINGTTSLLLYGTSATNDGAWKHLVVTRSGTTFNLYLNGVFEATASSSNSINTAVSFRIGASAAGVQLLTGRVDDIRLFNVVLDSSDAAYLYQGGVGRGRVKNSRSRRSAQSFIRGTF